MNNDDFYNKDLDEILVSINTLEDISNKYKNIMKSEPEIELNNIIKGIDKIVLNMKELFIAISRKRLTYNYDTSFDKIADMQKECNDLVSGNHNEVLARF